MVIEREQHGGRRKVKEALQIRRMKRRGGSMNQDSGWQRSKVWLDLVPQRGEEEQEQGQRRKTCVDFFFCQYIFYKDGQIANRS